MIAAEQVRLTYEDGTEALRGVSASFSGGELVAITGPSGSGKSTLLYCLAGIFLPTGGSIHVLNHELTQLNDSGRAQLRLSSMGFVFQESFLIAELTCLQNVQLPLLMRGMTKAEAHDEAMTQLDRFGVAHLAESRPAKISVGQGQRVAVARATAPRPQVIFADEPTGALDTENGEFVYDALLSEARQGACVIMVTHNDAMGSAADRRLNLADGTLVSAGLGEI